jgi:hypothetical protein
MRLDARLRVRRSPDERLVAESMRTRAELADIRREICFLEKLSRIEMRRARFEQSRTAMSRREVAEGYVLRTDVALRLGYADAMRDAWLLQRKRAAARETVLGHMARSAKQHLDSNRRIMAVRSTIYVREREAVAKALLRKRVERVRAHAAHSNLVRLTRDARIARGVARRAVMTFVVQTEAAERRSARLRATQERIRMASADRESKALRRHNESGGPRPFC